MGNNFMDDLHEIREKLTAEMEGMSPEEKASYINELAAKAKEEWGLDLPNAKNGRRADRG